MRVRILKDHDRRLGPAVVQALKADTDVTLPRRDAEDLIKAGIAARAPQDAKEAENDV